MMSAKARATPSRPSSSTSITRSDGSAATTAPRDVAAQERPPRIVAPPAEHDARERRIEPACRCARARRGAPRATPPRSWNASTVCARLAMRASSGMSLGREPARVAEAAPVLVERADRVGRLGGKAELERDRRAAVAADLDQLARRVRGARDRRRTAARARRATGRGATVRAVSTREPHARVPVHQLHARLHRTGRRLPNSAAMRPALLEQPASLSSSA